MDERSTWTATTHDWSHDIDLEHLAHIRERVALYGAGGRRHMILEVLAYANDEAESLGRVGTASVTTYDDGTVRVVDEGRGTDTRLDSDGRAIRKPVMATRDIRFFDAAHDASHDVALPDGRPRRGMSTVAALSTVLIHENHRVNGAWSQTYRNGVPDAELREIPAGSDPGTSVTFRADESVQGPSFLTTEDLTAFPWLRIEVASMPAVGSPMPTSAALTVSTDPDLLDLDTVHRWLSTDAYWALGRGREVVERAVAGSVNFGAYDGDRLVGYARVVTDRATFAWLCDVYVDPGHRGDGIGTALVAAVHERLAAWGVKRAMLATQDAHEVYARFGFRPLADPDLYMGRSYQAD